MTHKSYFQTSAGIFFVVAVAHLLRVIYGGKIIFMSWDIPTGVSIVAILIVGYMGYQGLKLAN